jgi:DNA-binding transcriptional LysR family regulator
MLSDLNQLRLLDALGRVHSLSAAASQMQTPLATVSRKLKQLELELGQKVLDRSARRFRLTEFGREMVRIATRSIDDLQSAAVRLSGERQSLSGEIRMTAPADFAVRYLSQAIKAFRDLHPQIRISLILTPRRVNLAEEGIDVAARVGAITHEDLISKHLVSITRAIYASSAFAHFAPVNLADAGRLPWIILGNPGPAQLSLRNVNTDARETLSVLPAVTADSLAMCAALVLDGAGCSVLPDVWMESEVAQGKIMRLWPDWHELKVDVHLLFTERQLPARVRAFVDFLSAWFAQLSSERPSD